MPQPTSSSPLNNPGHALSHKFQVDVQAHFGAVGDGSTDDTTAFQGAINAGYHVFVPTPPVHYVIKNKLTVTNTAGLHMRGENNLGSGPRILCNSFPASTDVFELPGTGFPILTLENLFFDHATGNAPRDFYRQTVSDTQNVVWRNVYVQNMGGFGYNAPAAKLAVAPRFENCSFIFCGSGGMTFAGGGNAVVIRNCRLAGNGGTADISITGGNGYTLDSIVFDGTTVSSGNFDRLKVAGNANGVLVLNPYIEWNATSASGTLRNIGIDSATLVTVIGGTGASAPSGGGYTLTPVEVNNSTAVTIINTPMTPWAGTSAIDLRVTNSTGVVAFVGTTAARVSVDTASQPYHHIFVDGRLLRYGQNMSGGTLSGTTAASGGARYAIVSNGGATNMSNLTECQDGHIITLLFPNGNTTLVDGAGGSGYFHMRGGVNYNPPANSTMTFLASGGLWYEMART